MPSVTWAPRVPGIRQKGRRDAALAGGDLDSSRPRVPLERRLAAPGRAVGAPPRGPRPPRPRGAGPGGRGRSRGGATRASPGLHLRASHPRPTPRPPRGRPAPRQPEARAKPGAQVELEGSMGPSPLQLPRPPPLLGTEARELRGLLEGRATEPALQKNARGGDREKTPRHPQPRPTSVLSPVGGALGRWRTRWSAPPSCVRSAPARGALPPSPFPQAPISQVWKVLHLDLCHSADTVIVKGHTEQRKTTRTPATPMTDSLATPRLPPLAASALLLPEELGTPRLMWRSIPPVAPAL